MKRNAEEIKRDLSHVYWIGGISRGGKSTVAESLKEEFGFSIYDHDKKWLGGDHVRMADPDRHPTMFKYRDLYEDLTNQSFLASGPVETLVEEFEREMVQSKYREKPEPWSDKDVEWHLKWRVRWKERANSQAEGLRLKVVETGGSSSLEHTIDLVKTHFGLCS
jgi:hypothetical protein